MNTKVLVCNFFSSLFLISSFCFIPIFNLLLLLKQGSLSTTTYINFVLLGLELVCYFWLTSFYVYLRFTLDPKISLAMAEKLVKTTSTMILILCLTNSLYVGILLDENRLVGILWGLFFRIIVSSFTWYFATHDIYGTYNVKNRLLPFYNQNVIQSTSSESVSISRGLDLRTVHTCIHEIENQLYDLRDKLSDTEYKNLVDGLQELYQRV